MTFGVVKTILAVLNYDAKVEVQGKMCLSDVVNMGRNGTQKPHTVS